LLLENQAAARSIRRGVLDLRICAGCGFVFNGAFDPDLLDYGQHYDNTQTHSPAFSAYVDHLIRSLVEEHGVHNRTIVEIGCGKGTFLRRLVAYPGANNTGIGFDPTYVGPATDCDGRLRFVRSFYGPEAAVRADVVLCRHVIEHVPDPLDFLQAIRGTIAADRSAQVFFETPCLEWILRHRVVWDLFYEHCSLFTPSSLRQVFRTARFDVRQVEHVFGGQYLWLHATTGPQRPLPGPASIPVAELVALARSFGLHAESARVRWLEQLRYLTRLGRTALWGAGAKGVTFCNLIDPEAARITCVVDVNPGKQGRFIAGTGHRIVAPEKLAAEGVAHLLVLNPNYRDEVAGQVAELGLRARVIDLMEELGAAVPRAG
jgi:SAM-dependent methyltransferase